jgi:hypothetical protein
MLFAGLAIPPGWADGFTHSRATKFEYAKLIEKLPAYARGATKFFDDDFAYVGLVATIASARPSLRRTGNRTFHPKRDWDVFGAPIQCQNKSDSPCSFCLSGPIPCERLRRSFQP